MNRQNVCTRIWVSLILLVASPAVAAAFEGQFYRGEGDDEYLQLLDISRRMFEPDPEFQNLPMLYLPAWNGFVEGPTWGAWWIQNSYGPTYCALPVFQEPLVTFLQNAQDLWFTQMGDGKRAGANNWVAPDGCLCDAAAPNWIYYKQGDGRVDIHDWGVEFTAAGLLMQAELLLISRDEAAIQHYLPLLERCANFIETRRDPEKNLFLAGPAGNLLAPSYAGCRQPDGSYGQAYLAGLSITYIAALDRLIELEKLAGATEQVQRYTERRDAARRGSGARHDRRGLLPQVARPGRHEARGLRRGETRLLRSRLQPRRHLLPRGRGRTGPPDHGQTAVDPRPPAARSDHHEQSVAGRHVCPGQWAVAVRHVGQRRALDDLRSPHADGLFPAGMLRGFPPCDAADHEVRPRIPSGQSAGRFRRRRVPARRADQPVLRQFRAPRRRWSAACSSTCIGPKG